MPVNHRIIVVDDEPGILDAYRIILNPTASAGPRLVSSRRGAAAAAAAAVPQSQAAVFEVTYVATGELALAEIQKALAAGTPFAGGFFDVKLGSGIDGIETIRRAKDLDPQIICCMVTAYQDRNLDEINKIFGEEYSDRWDFLTKPFSHNEILQKARNLVSNWDKRQREREHLKQIETQHQQLIRTERLAAIGSLARGIGHEFGNILHRIIGVAELAARKNDPKDMNESLKLIATASERAGAIVRNLQSLVKMQAQREALNLYEPFKECQGLLEHEFHKSQVKLVENWEGSLPRVQANRVEIGQVFLNILINAVHAMEPKGGTLTVKSSVKDTMACVEFTDTGCGIAADVLPQIFEPLFSTKGDRGTGIGLSVAKKIVTNHGGRIEVHSAVGKGTTFAIYLPTK